jgi:hypothetical protein
MLAQEPSSVGGEQSKPVRRVPVKFPIHARKEYPMPRKQKALKLCLTAFEPGRTPPCGLDDRPLGPDAVRELYPTDADGQHISFDIATGRMDAILALDIKHGLPGSHVAQLLRKLATWIERHDQNLLGLAEEEFGRFDTDGNVISY